MASMNTPAIANNHSGARKVRRRRVSDGDSGGDSRESFMWRRMIAEMGSDPISQQMGPDLPDLKKAGARDRSSRRSRA